MGWSVSCSVLPAPHPVGTEQGSAPTRAGKRTPPSSARLYSAEGCPCKVLLVCSTHAPEVREKTIVWGCQPLVYWWLQVFHSHFCSQKIKWEFVVESTAPKESREDACGKGTSFSWNISQAHFDQQLEHFSSTRNFFFWGMYSLTTVSNWCCHFLKMSFWISYLLGGYTFIHRIKNCMHQLVLNRETLPELNWKIKTRGNTFICGK